MNETSVARLTKFSDWLLADAGNLDSIFNDRNSPDEEYRRLAVIYSAAAVTLSVLSIENASLQHAMRVDPDVDLTAQTSRIKDAIEVISISCASQLLVLGPESSRMMRVIANEHPEVAYAMSKLGRE
jgi:hypothetical protein